MANKSKRRLNKFRPLLILFLACLTVIAVFPLAWKFSEQRNIQAVDPSALEWMPVLVFTSGDINLLWYRELPNFTKSHPDYSFLIPQGQENLMNERLITVYKNKVPTADAFPKFEVNQLSENRQSFEVGLYGDGETVVWYEATDKEIFPQRYKSLGPLFPIIPLFWGVVFSGIAWGLVYGILKLYKEMRLTVA